MFKQRDWVWNWRGLRGVHEPTEKTLLRRAWAVASGKYKFYPDHQAPFFEWAVAHSAGVVVIIVGVAIIGSLSLLIG